MNSLSNTKVFKEFIDSNLGKDVLKMMQYNNLKNYIIDKKWYEHFVKIYKTYKYPLAKTIVDYVNRDLIKVINYGDPENTDVPIFNLQAYLSTFIAKNEIGEYVSYTNIAPKAHFIRNKISNEIESLKISERNLYAYLQMATTNMILFKNKDNLLKNDKFIKLCTEMYSSVLSKCIDKTFPISAEREQIIILNYIINLFVLQTMFNMNEEKARTIGLQIKNVDKSIVTNLNRSFHLSLKMENIDDLIKVIENEFTFLRKGSLTYRNLMLMFTRMYGQNSIFCIEHFSSFLIMMQTSNLRIGMYNDTQLDNFAKTYVDNIDKILLTYA